MSAGQYLFALFVAIAWHQIPRAIHFYLMSAWQFSFDSYLALEFRAVFSAPFLAQVPAQKYLLARLLTFDPNILRVAHNLHNVAARLHLLFDLCDAGLAGVLAFEALLFAIVAAVEGADTNLHALPVIVPCRVLHRLSHIRVADGLAAMTAV